MACDAGHGRTGTGEMTRGLPSAYTPDDVRAYLVDQGRKTVYDLCEHFDLCSDRVSKYLKPLLKSGQVERIRTGNRVYFGAVVVDDKPQSTGDDGTTARKLLTQAWAGRKNHDRK